ncbi:hypothetical protein BKA81DRAFT_23117 [Phyllosticta paracitricarpa]
MEITPSDAHADPKVDRLVKVCQMPVDKVPVLRGVGEKVELTHRHPTWNCLDFVLELIMRAEQREGLDLEEGRSCCCGVRLEAARSGSVANYGIHGARRCTVMYHAGSPSCS